MEIQGVRPVCHHGHAGDNDNFFETSSASTGRFRHVGLLKMVHSFGVDGPYRLGVPEGEFIMAFDAQRSHICVEMRLFPYCRMDVVVSGILC